LPQYSVIIPVFNRPEEMKEMLDSLVNQTVKDFEVIIVEDGSTVKSEHLISKYESELQIRYFFKENTGPGDSRNYGMERAFGNYFLFFDSDCVLPKDYFEYMGEGVAKQEPDAFGGPDAAHESFSLVQKAINYSMTSFLTTGGIRGGTHQLDKYQPRSFNMGISKKVFDRVGGFSDIHPGEDPDLSFRIIKEGFKISLIPKAFVYHKRRINFMNFIVQVYKFGVTRVILNRWHPLSGKLVYFFPSMFLLILFLAILSATLWLSFLLIPFAIYASLIFIDSLFNRNGLVVSALAILAAFCQLCGYGYGFLKAQICLNIFGQKERLAFPSFFFNKK